MTTVCGKSVDDLLECDKFKKSLRDAEHVIQYINKTYISLNDRDYTIYAEHLKTVLTKLVKLMKDKDSVFNTYYQREHFAGSYPDGLKIGKPTEYDMNLIIKLPGELSTLKFELATPSFIMIKVNEPTPAFEQLRWLDADGYLLQTKFRDWMESVLTKAFDTLPMEPGKEQGNTRRLTIQKDGDGQEVVYKIRYKKSGPAMTVQVTTPDCRELDVDLVPAFEFGPQVWPCPPVAQLPENCTKKNWMVVPKPKKVKEGEPPEPNDTREWRMSFLDQERQLLNGSGTVKPTIKLLKKLRDSRGIKLSSYAIKSVILSEKDKQANEFWKNRQIYLFLYMLNRLTEQVKTGHIPFYWDGRDDLLKMGKLQFDNVSNRLGNILKDIIKGIETNPYVIAEKLLTKEECMDVKENCKIPTAIAPLKPSLALAIRGSEPVHQTNNNDSILSKILQKVEEIHMEQKQQSRQLLQVAVQNRGFERDDTSKPAPNHEECLKKQGKLEKRITYLEEHINDLDDVVQLMKQEIRQLSRR